MKRTLPQVISLFCLVSANAFATYDPSAGKWLSRDPLEESGGINLTQFCRNDPVNNIDPLGLDYVSVEGGNVYWNVEEDSYLYNPDVNRFLIGSVADDSVTFSKAFGGGTASLRALNKYANRFWDRPVSGSVMDPTDISSMTADVQRGIVQDYLQHYVREYGYAVLQEDRGMFTSKTSRNMDVVQGGLDVVGMAEGPGLSVIGAGAGVLNTGISLGRGRLGDAGWNSLAIIPVAGTFLSKGKYARKAIVIGEGMADVREAGRRLDAKWYQAWRKNFPDPAIRQMTPQELEAALKRNRRWIEGKVREGYIIYDIGPRTPGQITSPFYRREAEYLEEIGYSVIKVPR